MAISQLDDLPEQEREQLVTSLSRHITNEKHRVRSDPKIWKIPNSSKLSRTLNTYGFPKHEPQIWLAKTEFPNRNTTRDAILVALAGDPHSNDEVVIAFEFNIDRRVGRNRMNFRFQKRHNGTIKVRCLGSFAHHGVRQKASLFYDFLRTKSAHGLRLEPVDPSQRQYVVLLELPGTDVSSKWREIWTSLAQFARLVTDFKNWLDKKRLGSPNRRAGPNKRGGSRQKQKSR
ncbi:MAG TPA: hypothetical protein VF815_11290 [Myxococcaceae bacterium]|jgi:hypothetical protein